MDLEVFCDSGEEPHGVYVRGMHDPYEFLHKLGQAPWDTWIAIDYIGDEDVSCVFEYRAEDVHHCWVHIPKEDEGKFLAAAPGEGDLVTYVARDGVRLPGEHVPFNRDEVES